MSSTCNGPDDGLVVQPDVPRGTSIGPQPSASQQPWGAGCNFLLPAVISLMLAGLGLAAQAAQAAPAAKADLVSQVPEPATLAMLGLGAVWMAWGHLRRVRRRQYQKSAPKLQIVR